MSQATKVKDNPYVGPRPFRREELFFGRERESTSIVNSLLSSRIMLLHSPSGAGKTSLVQAAVVPAFEGREFRICAQFNPEFTGLRVNLPPPPGLPIANRYVYSVVNGLVGDVSDRNVACRMTLPEAFDRYVGQHDLPPRQLMVLDQLEEIVTLDYGDVDGQEEFFRQLGKALDDDRRWALLAMREDHMGALDRFRRFLPGQLRSTYRIDLLTKEVAIQAVVRPARERGVTFSPVAANLLVDDLGHASSGLVGPVLLQVVCYRLFHQLNAKRGESFTEVSAADVEGFKPFGHIIAKYYRQVLKEVTAENRVIERGLRDWIERRLISKEIRRRQTREMPAVPEPEALLGALQTKYLIRDDPRPGGSPFWELSHDVLVAPILSDNRAWRAKYLERWQCLAQDWIESNRDDQYLLHSADYLAAPPVGKRDGLTEEERDFLAASQRSLEAEGRLTYLERRQSELKSRLGRFTALLAVSLLINAVLLILLLLPR